MNYYDKCINAETKVGKKLLNQFEIEDGKFLIYVNYRQNRRSEPVMTVFYVDTENKVREIQRPKFKYTRIIFINNKETNKLCLTYEMDLVNKGFSNKLVSLRYDSTTRKSSSHQIMNLIHQYVGMDYNDFITSISNRSNEKQLNRENRRLWLNDCPYFDKYIVGIDRKSVSIFNTGYMVFVSMSSSISFDEQLDFVKKYKKQIIEYVHFTLNEMANSRRIKMISFGPEFYQVVDITLSRRNELRFVFELKEGIIKELEK